MASCVLSPYFFFDAADRVFFRAGAFFLAREAVFFFVVFLRAVFLVAFFAVRFFVVFLRAAGFFFLATAM